MQVSDLVVEVRDSSLARVGQLLPKDLEGFTAVLRFNAPGTWTLTLPTDHVLVDALRAPGAGLIVTGPDFAFSGPTNEATRSQSTDDPEGTWSISGLTDDVIFGERLAYPTPGTADVTAQTSDYDVRTGDASSVLFGYVDANVGPSAPTGRRIPSLILAADDALGSTITASARFETLGKLLTRLAAIDGLGFTLYQSGDDLVFDVYQPTDRSAYVRFDIDNNLLTKSEYTYTAPGATRAIVAGQGAGADRAFVEVTTTESSAAETAWGRRIEVFKDQRSDSDTDALTQAGTEELAEKGKTLEAVSVSPSDDVTMSFGTDWFLGDKVSVVVGETSVAQIVTEVGFKISEDGVRIGATVGSPMVADAESTVVEKQDDQETRISNLERNETDTTGGGGGGGGGGSHGLPTGGLEGQILAKDSDDNYDAMWVDNVTVLENLSELLDVSLDTPADNELLAFDSGSSLWKNQTPAEAGLASATHSHAIADVTGLQAALDSKVDETSETVSSGWLTAGTGWGSVSGIYTEKNGIVQVNLRATRTGASISAGNITNVNVLTIASGYRPIAETAAISGPSGPLASAYIATTGGLALSALGTTLSTGDAIDINATYIKA